MFNKKIKNIISLALAIGIIGGAGSLAYFSDKEVLGGELNLTLGTLSSEVKKTIKIDNMDIEKEVNDTFVLLNNGTLNQRVVINFLNPSIGEDGLEKIKYSLDFESSNKEKKIKSYGGGKEKINSLFNKEIYLLDENGEEIYLEEGETLIAKLTLIMERDMPESYSGKEFKFDLKVGYLQENDE